jgi:hypothetical protein
MRRLLVLALPLLLAPSLLACGKDDPQAAQAPVDPADSGDDTAVEDVATEAGGSAFLPGPYGTKPRDVAGPAVIPTTDGELALRDVFTGEDHFVFVTYTARIASQKSLFRATQVSKLLAASPKNVHYFFQFLDDQPGFDAFVAAAAPVLDEYWRPRVHFVTTQVDKVEGWLGDVVRNRAAAKYKYELNDRLAFGIDRTQHVREIGMLGRLGASGTVGDLSFAASEPQYWEFELAREKKLAAVKATVVPVLSDKTIVESEIAEVTLPDAATMASFDTLETDLTMHCESHRDGECGAWDYISDLRLCEDAPDGGAPKCDTEIARWITTYWREGRWVTDVSGMLAFLQDGGKKKLRWYASKQWDPRPANYVVSLSLRLSNSGKGMRPFLAKKLWDGGALNADYASKHPAQTVDVPAGTKKAELFALITGHGSETGQCAEFCNHTHHFTVNGGARRSQTFPMAQSADGCRKRVGEGVVPNQHGTWYFGRGGWCPGFDVAPFVADVTADAKIGASNSIAYEALIGTSAPESGSAYGNVYLSTYLVLWK